jgi:calcineurin-like phosphoesterase
VQSAPGERLTVGQVMGRVFMEPLDDPFAAADAIVDATPPAQALLIDVHAEATSEKKVLGYHLQGRASAVIGTHTHVQTADEGVHGGTAYITDVGMSGVQHSSIGMQFDEVHARFTTRRPHRYRPAAGRPPCAASSSTWTAGGPARSSASSGTRRREADPRSRDGG